MSQPAISLGNLEADLGLSRVDLLLAMREAGVEPLRRGMRTWVRQEEVPRIYEHLGRSNPRESLEAEVISVESNAMDSALARTAAPPEDVDEDLKKYSKLKLLRERIEVLDLLERTKIELSSPEVCHLLDLKRIPTLISTGEGALSFQRMGLTFSKVSRPGQRSAWSVSKSRPD